MSKSALSVGWALVPPYTCAIQIDGSGSRERFFATIDRAMTGLVEVHGYARAEMLSASDEVVASDPSRSISSFNGIYYGRIEIPATMTATELDDLLPEVRTCSIDLFERVSELTRVHAPIEAEVNHG
jgi:hypothetical protein